jgi:hypothetical protein
MEPLALQRHAFALQRLAGTRFTSPVHEGHSPGGTLSVLAGHDWRISTGGDPGADLVLTNAVKRPEEQTADACSPAALRRRLGRYGTLLLVDDHGVTTPGTAYPPRPRHLRLGPAGRVDCVGRAHVIRFSDAGRDVQVIAAFGREQNRWGRRDARGVLDSLRVEA